MLDRIDRQIVHCLQRDARASFRRLAGVVGVSEQTVARRYRAMYTRGVVRPLTLPDPRRLSRRRWMLRVACRPESIDRLAANLAQRAEVRWISIIGAGGELLCVIDADSEASAALLLQRLARTKQVLTITGYEMLHLYVDSDAEWSAFDDPLDPAQATLLHGDAPIADPEQDDGQPGLPTQLRPDDWPLLTELARDGRADAATLARAVGRSRHRVSTRLTQLLGSGILHTELDLAPQAFDFHTCAYVWLTVAPGDLRTTGQAIAAHRVSGFTAALTGSANLVCCVYCRDSDALYEHLATEIGALDVVHSVEIVPVLRQIKQAATRVHNGRLIVAAR